MSPVLWALMIVGALAVMAFVVFLVVWGVTGKRDGAANRLLTLAAALGVGCAVLGLVLAFTSN